MHTPFCRTCPEGHEHGAQKYPLLPHAYPHWQLVGAAEHAQLEPLQVGAPQEQTGGLGHVQLVPLHVGWPHGQFGAVPHGDVTVNVPFAGGGHPVFPFVGLQDGYTV
jgi:hypothetical protein